MRDVRGQKHKWHNKEECQCQRVKEADSESSWLTYTEHLETV